MINRSAILLRYKEPFVKWINDADPCEDDPGITLEDANTDKMIYLITVTDGDVYDHWINQNWDALFQSELDGWYGNETLWPQNRTKKMFDEWFEVECHTVLVDTVGGKITEDVEYLD